MRARRVEQNDGRYGIKSCWSHCEVLVLTPVQHRVFGRLLGMQFSDAGSETLFDAGLLQALFRLAAYPWWDASVAGIPEEPLFEPMPGA